MKGLSVAWMLLQQLLLQLVMPSPLSNTIPAGMTQLFPTKGWK